MGFNPWVRSRCRVRIVGRQDTVLCGIRFSSSTPASHFDPSATNPEHSPSHRFRTDLNGERSRSRCGRPLLRVGPLPVQPPQCNDGDLEYRTATPIVRRDHARSRLRRTPACVRTASTDQRGCKTYRDVCPAMPPAQRRAGIAGRHGSRGFSRAVGRIARALLPRFAWKRFKSVPPPPSIGRHWPAPELLALPGVVAAGPPAHEHQPARTDAQ